MRFRLGGVNELSTIDGDGISLVVYFQGCNRRCEGCHNPELQPFTGGKKADTDDVIAKIAKHRDWYDSIVFQGGEPLAQLKPLLLMLKAVKKNFPEMKTWLYTGHDIDDVPVEAKTLCDVIVAGEFRQDLHVAGRFPASINQVVWRNDKS